MRLYLEAILVKKLANGRRVVMFCSIFLKFT